MNIREHLKRFDFMLHLATFHELCVTFYPRLSFACVFLSFFCFVFFSGVTTGEILLLDMWRCKQVDSSLRQVDLVRSVDSQRFLYLKIQLGVSINGGTPKWMVYKGKSH